jgi:hypothetical protein
VQARLVWLPSGDEVEFRVIWPDLFLYWLGRLGTNHSFFCTAPSAAQTIRDSLQQNINAIKGITAGLPPLITVWPDDLYDQRQLNQLHRDWVIAGQRWPKLPLLLQKMNLERAWRAINEDIHRIENCFSWQFQNYEVHPWQVHNKFGTKFLDHATSHIMLGFDNLGRSTWEKFSNYDSDEFELDTNNFEMLSGKVEISLSRPMMWTMPENYKNWCALHKVPEVGRNMRIGNFADDIKTITKLRYLFTSNEHQPANTISFAL